MKAMLKETASIETASIASVTTMLLQQTMMVMVMMMTMLKTPTQVPALS